PRERVEPLVLAGVLELRHEVRRSDADVAIDVDADDAPGGARIVGPALEPDLPPPPPPERILRAIVGAARVRETRLVHEPRPEHLVPAADDRVRIQVVLAPGGCRRAVEHAAKPAGHEPEAVAADVTDENIVGVAEGEIDPREIPIGPVFDVRLPDEVVGAGGVG